MADAKDIVVYDDDDDPDLDDKEVTGTKREISQGRMKINMRERIFVANYLIDFNRKRAAIAAGYKESTANAAAYNLLNRKRVADAIEEGGRKKLQALEKTADDVFIQLQNTVFSDIRKVAPFTLDYLDDATAAAIQSVKLVKRRVNDQMIGPPSYEDIVEFKLVDKNAAVLTLAKMMGLMGDKTGGEETEKNMSVKQLLDQIDGKDSGLPPDKA